ncbi:E3 SUMO-protein ligase ZBED1-like [Triplophysa rosa]|uniref:E3 SUMO-protein ligase ZBED1-like n=1 Tax=Triplophysa rosa TaxID=992332 RepID=UPI002546015F|nr:E3 SUMO-protein ligase ZBED1-like [Triplophysa rosa]
MSESGDESESNINLSSKDDKIVDKKGNTNSVIWKWFGYLKSDETQIKPICKICRRSVPTKTGNTTNLFHHLKKYHPSDHTESMKLRADAATSTTIKAGEGAVPKQKSVLSSFAAITTYESSSKRCKDITRAVSYFIEKDMLPLSTVEQDGFRKLVKVLDCRYELPGRKYFSKTALPQLYEECRGKLENQLRNVRYFSTTTDLWSSRTSEPYMSLTIHYIDEEWALQSRCLQMAYFPDDHTAEILSAGLEDALASWGLSEDRQVCITTDNAANIVKAVSLNHWTRLQCFGHRGKYETPENPKSHGGVQKSGQRFFLLVEKKRELAATQEELKLPKHKLITESPTRWGSRHAMIARVLEQEKAISKVLSADKKTRHLAPSWQDIDVLESVCKALNPLADFTNALSGEEYVSVSYLKPVLKHFNEEVLKHVADDSELTKTIKSTVINYLNEKYGDAPTDDLLNIASLVDPRFKTQYIKDDKVEEAVKSRAMAQMLDECQNQTTSQATPALPSTSKGGDAATATPDKLQKKTLGSFFKKSYSESLAATTSDLTEQQAVEAELNSYLQAPYADSETNPIAWWKINSTTYPRLSLLAKRYLCIPATSSPSERAFSTGGNIVSCNRAALKPDAVDRLVFLAKNL